MHSILTKNYTHNFNSTQLINQLMLLCQRVPTACLLVSNDANAKFDYLLAYHSQQHITTNTNALATIEQFRPLCQHPIFGHIGYDVKNEIEHLSSNNIDYQGFDATHFFEPQLLLEIKNSAIIVSYTNEQLVNEVMSLFFDTNNTLATLPTTPCNLVATTTKDEYITNVNTIKQHIQQGDIYIANYCITYVSNATTINPYQKFITLNAFSKAPFSAFYKYDTKYVLCASPERYLQRTGNKVLSMPIKGTRKRGNTPAEDLAIAHELKHNAKEQNENVMIVDLVRNDLAQLALPNSVKVNELFEVHTFNAVHQLISTISSEVASAETPTNSVKTTFPMGSMTGAPKVSAMQLMENFENFKRGIYSGTIGYISPNNDFDFNVVIRSVIYNATTHTVSLPVGSAITNKCNAIDEYNECLLKAKALLAVM